MKARFLFSRLVAGFLLLPLLFGAVGCVYVRDLSDSGADINQLARLMTRHTVETESGRKQVRVVAVDGRAIDPEVTQMVTLRPGAHEISVSYTKSITRVVQPAKHEGLQAAGGEKTSAARSARGESEESVMFSALEPKKLPVNLDRGRSYYVTADDLFLIVKRGTGDFSNGELYALEGNWNPMLVER